jgi:methylmalonyl-CoA epimerase
MDFLGIDHLGIAVRDLEAATRTYRDVLGLTPSGGETLEKRGLEVRFFETGNARIELLGEIAPNSEIAKFLEKRGEGIHHICLKVADIEASVEKMKAAGAQLVGGISNGAHGTRVAFVHPKSTNGVLVELVEAHDKEK